jgi:O-antigen biosynthesis protein
MNVDRVAIIADCHFEYTTANYFRDVFEELEVPFRIFLPYEQKKIPEEYNIYFYVDDGSHYIIYPNDKVTKVLYIIDTHMGLDWDLYLIRFADIVFCAQKNAVESIKEINSQVFWLPLACDLKTHYQAGCELKYDIGFVGGIADGRRVRILKVLQEKYPGSYIGRAEKNEIAKIYSSSRIVVNIAINNDINMRFFEGMCSGALLLTDPIHNNGMEDLLSQAPDPFFVQYQDIDDLCIKIDFYLGNESERQTIASTGKAFAHGQTYHHRWLTIVDHLKANSKLSQSLVLYYVYNVSLFLKRATSRLKRVGKRWS